MALPKEPYLLRLSGDPKEIGRAHGQAAKDAGAFSAVDFYSNFLDYIFDFEVSGKRDRSWRKKFRWLVSETVERSLSEMLPGTHREMIHGFSETSGISYAKLMQGQIMPDAYSFLVSQRYRWRGALAWESVHLGCTSFAWASSDSKGPFLHARNLDYPGGEVWNQTPAIIEYAPADGQSYVSLTSLGVDTAGITSMNESGIVLSLHMNYSKRSSMRGTPILVIGNEIMKRAKTLTEAVQIAGKFKAAAGWSFLLSSAKERTAVAVQMDSQSLTTRYMSQGKLILTNHYSNPEQARHEYWITPGRMIDSRARYQRVAELLEEKKAEAISVEGAVRILSESTDPNLKENRTFGSTIAQVHTTTSVVFDPANQKIFMALGSPPMSKQNYYGFEVFRGPRHTEEVVEAQDDGLDAARREYALAHDYYFPANNLEKIIFHIRKAVSLAPQDPLFCSMLALVLLKQGEAGEARKQMEKVLTLSETPYRAAQNRLYLARILDHLGLRPSALEIYQSLQRDIYFSKAARRGIRKPWKPADSKKLILDFTLGDVIDR